MTVATGAPADLEELWREYRVYVRNLLRQQSIPAQECDDVASDILTRLSERDIISMYDPEHVVSHRGKDWHTSFRTFLSAQVCLYARGHRERITRHNGREVLLCDEDVDGTTWAEVFGGAEQDDYSHLDAEEWVAQMRERLQALPPPAPRDRCDLVTLFDVVVEQIRTEGRISHAALQEHFGISSTASYLWMGRLRAALTSTAEPEPVSAPVLTWVVGGMVLTVADLQQIRDVLAGSAGIMVRQPLAKAGFVFPEPNWYHPFSAEERAAYPSIEVGGRDHRNPAGHVKTAVIHRLERMLAEAGVQPSSPPEPPEPEPSLEDLLDYELFHLGADPAKLEKIKELARAVYCPAS